MIHSNTQADAQSIALKQPKQSPWFWLLLSGGSIVLHGLLIYWIGISALYARLQSAPEDSTTSIDLVELPESESAATQPTAEAAPESVSAQPVQASASDGTNAAAPSLQADDSIVVAAPPAAKPAAKTPVSAPKPADAPVAEPSQLATEPPARPAAPTTPAAPAPTAPPQPVSAAADPEASERFSTAVVPSVVPSVVPLPSEVPSPLIATLPIDVPVPDVSETLPIPTESASVVTNQVTIPSHLVASITSSPAPEGNEAALDAAAEPKTEVQTFSSNPANSPCLVTPEAVRFLGKTVAMQVVTDKTGQVIQTRTQESSQNPAYDALATCLVKNWEFEPAIARGEPVENDGLVVRITIDRG